MKKKNKPKKNNNQRKQEKNRAGQTAPKKTIKQKRNYENVKKIIARIIKIIAIIAFIVAIAIFFFTSPVFNIKTIEVKGNNKVSTEEIIKLSQIETNQNIYKVSKNAVKDNIKENAYIENVQVYRMLPDKIEIEVKERTASFMIQINGKYAYINNQGYILEINSENIFLPIIAGYATLVDNIIPGNRLEQEDLIKLETVLTIMESANSNQMSELITTIDISNPKNYTLTLNNEEKTVYLGDASNISTRMHYLKGILQNEKGNPGEVFIDGNLTTQKVYFREKI